MSQFYDRALQLKRRGYTVVPIKSGMKGPSGLEAKGWEDNEYDEKALKRMSLNGYADGNIGINARFAPAIDLDVYDENMADILEAFLLERLGDTCVRIGRAPKRLLMYRTSKPFTKMYAALIDPEGGKHKIEILGDGQQYLAYGIHPDTGSDYYYTSLEEPLAYSIDELPELTHADATEALEAMTDLLREHGWTISRTSLGRERGEGGEDFDLTTLKPVMKITEASVRETLEWIPNDDDYDIYLDVGMALHHQFDGGERGLEIWHEWAQQSTKYKAEDVNYRWESFGRGPATLTFSTMVYRARENEAAAAEQAFSAQLNRISRCNDKRQIERELAKDLMRTVQTDLQYDEAVRVVQRRLGELSDGMKPRLESVRKTLDRARPKSEKTRELPKWCENWYYIASENMFYNTHTASLYTQAAFDGVYGEELLTDEHRNSGEAFAGRASVVALNLHRIPKVYARMYLPGYDEVVKVNGQTCVNTYNRWNEPKEQEPKTASAKKAVRMAEKHFEFSFPNERERNLILDFLSYTVQFPTEKINWAVLVQGVDGGGKSWFASLMAAVLGGENVGMISAAQLKETYTKWAEGNRMVFFEEIRLHGESRFEILDKLKPYVTNATVPVRRMRMDSYSIMNVTNYMMFTNFPDALPINQNDRRYLILRSSFQTKADLRSFKSTHPGYFVELFDMLTTEWPALRWWLLNRKIADDFDAKGDAPDTEAKEWMIDDSENEDDMQTLQEMIDDPDLPLIGDVVLVAAALREGMSPLAGLNKRAMGSLLHRAGFAKVGQFRIGDRVKKDTIYTKRGDLYRGKDALTVIKTYLDSVDPLAGL